MNQKQFEEVVTETERDIKENLNKLYGQLSAYCLVATPTFNPRLAKEHLIGYIDSSYERLEKISSKFGIAYKKPIKDTKNLLHMLGEKAKKHAEDYDESLEKLSPVVCEKKLDELDKKAEEEVNNLFEEFRLQSG